MRYRLRHRRLQRELERRRISQNRWAQVLGVSKSHLSMLVNGKRPYPTEATRDKLIEGLGVRPEDLFVIEDPEPLPAPERTPMDAVVQDFTHAWRAVRRRPGLAAVIVVTLALGIGATTAMYSIVDATLLRPLPFENADRLVRIFGVNPERGLTRGQLSMANVIDWRERADSFEGLATYRGRSFNLAGAGDPERVIGLLVADGFLEMIGRTPQLGRVFTDSEHRAGGDPVVLISDGLWRERFDGSPTVIGRTVRIDTTEQTVVGVLPPDFDDVALLLGWSDVTPEVVLPLEVEPKVDRGAYWQLGVARLRPGATVATAQAELDEIMVELERTYPDEVAGHRVALVPLPESISGEVRTTLLLFLGAVVAVLAIGCVNVASLMTAYAGARRRESAVRTALGAGPARLARLGLAECLLLAAAGGLLGLGLAALALELLRPALPAAILRAEMVRLDPRAFGVAAALSVLTALLFGAAPSLRAARTDPRAGLGSADVTGLEPRRARLLGGLVVAQIALAGVVAVGSGLVARSYARLVAVDPGFRTEGVLTFYTIPRYNFDTAATRNAFVTDLLRSLEEIPGVLDVGEINFLPFTDNEAQQGVEIEGRPAPEGNGRWGWYRAVDDGFFRVLGVNMLEGRPLERADMAPVEAPADGPRTSVAVVNRTMADRYWPDRDALGSRFQAGGDTWYRIVGVAPDLKWHGFDEEPGPRFYLPYREDFLSTRGFLLRLDGDPLAVGAAVRRAVFAIEPDQSVYDIQSLEQRLHASVAPRRFSLLTLSTFAGLALVLALVGTYAAVSWTVGRRTGEIGIRMALGARSGQVRAMLLRRTATLAATGAALALLGSRLLAGAISSYLFEVTPGDPLVLGAVVGVLLAAAVAATWAPAQRAARIDPARALRN